jgi:hypothetical protein
VLVPAKARVTGPTTVMTHGGHTRRRGTDRSAPHTRFGVATVTRTGVLLATFGLLG